MEKMDNKEIASLIELVGMMNLQSKQLEKNIDELNKKIKGEIKNGNI